MFMYEKRRKLFLEFIDKKVLQYHLCKASNCESRKLENVGNIVARFQHFQTSFFHLLEGLVYCF